MNDPNEVKPCPFCGHAELSFVEGTTFRWLHSECTGCGASCGEIRIQTMGKGTAEQWLEAAKKETIAAWNTRTGAISDAAHAAKLDALIAYCPTCTQGVKASSNMTHDEVIFECGKASGREAYKRELAAIAAGGQP